VSDSDISWAICKSAPNLQTGNHASTPTQFLQTGCPFCRPTDSKKELEAKCTHTHLTALFPGLPGWAGTTKVKPIWILLKQQTVSGISISWAICKSAPRSRQITTPAPHHSVFYRLDALPAVQPTASKHWRKQNALKCKRYWALKCWKTLLSLTCANFIEFLLVTQ